MNQLKPCHNSGVNLWRRTKKHTFPFFMILPFYPLVCCFTWMSFWFKKIYIYLQNMETLLSFYSVLLVVCAVQRTASKHGICWVVVGLNLSPVCGLHCSFIGLCVVNLPLTLIPRPPLPCLMGSSCSLQGQPGPSHCGRWAGWRCTLSLSVPEQLIIPEKLKGLRSPMDVNYIRNTSTISAPLLKRLRQFVWSFGGTKTECPFCVVSINKSMMCDNMCVNLMFFFGCFF